MTTATAQMTSATYLPAGCKRVKLNLAGAYRTTYTHLVPGDEIRIQRSLYRETFDPTPGNAPSRSFWAKVTKVERGAGWVAVEVESAWYTGQVSWTAPHTAVTRKERQEETSARLMLAEQERTAAVKASEEELTAALAEWSGRKASGRYLPGKTALIPAGLVIPVEEQTADMPIRRGVQVWHPDYVGTVWVVRFTHGGGLGSDLVADLVHFGTGDQLRDVKVTDLTVVTTANLAVAIPFNPAGTAQTSAAVAAATSITAGTAAAIPAQRTATELDDARLIAEVAYARGGQPAQDLADMRVRALKAEAKLEQIRATMDMLRLQGRDSVADEADPVVTAQVGLLDVLIRLLDS